MNSGEIAKLAKVSRSTVSRVLNHHAGVTDKMRERVEAVIREQNYVPDAAARKLAGKENRIIGLFIIDTADTYEEHNICTTPFYNDYIAQSIDIANSRGYDLLIRVVHHQNSDELEHLFQNRSIAGGIIMGDRMNDSLLEHLTGRQYRMVLYNQITESPAANVVVVNYNNFKCGRMAGEELIRRGHKRIAMVTGETNKICAMERLEGLKAAMRGASLTLDCDRYVECGAFHRQSGGYEATRRLLKRNLDHMPTAICAGSAAMMMGTMQAVIDMGFQIPQDISLIGIDGNSLSQYTVPTLTEVQISRKRVALVTVTRLIELIENGETPQHEYEISEAELIQRDSVKILSTE
ncbi:LacI family DNA-binding transcriptional regulator [Oscillibacter sp.]|uniref:LacI family DNA-binding transcriptional regulator n=1 Tax=Oscillibacter sp. TaxID=1945593 RepID=UPI00261360CF|nr:LacI family DNA-binding transcriptional regulator [Oscillibacter sp.]MDD3347983.1 LacI family DNA-binding transcriptional regulator [Oscillibacter sp.]